MTHLEVALEDVRNIRRGATLYFLMDDAVIGPPCSVAIDREPDGSFVWRLHGDDEAFPVTEVQVQRHFQCYRLLGPDEAAHHNRDAHLARLIQEQAERINQEQDRQLRRRRRRRR